MIVRFRTMMQRETPPHERASTIGFAYAVTFSMIVAGQVAVVPLSNCSVSGRRSRPRARSSRSAAGRGALLAECRPRGSARRGRSPRPPPSLHDNHDYVKYKLNRLFRASGPSLVLQGNPEPPCTIRGLTPICPACSGHALGMGLREALGRCRMLAAASPAAGSGGVPGRLRSSGRSRRSAPRRSPRRTCTHRCRCAPLRSRAAGRGRSTRSSEAASTWPGVSQTSSQSGTAAVRISGPSSVISTFCSRRTPPKPCSSSTRSQSTPSRPRSRASSAGTT